MFGNRRWAVYGMCFFGLMFHTRGVALAADPFSRLLSALKPKAWTKDSTEVLNGTAQMVTERPSNPPCGLNRMGLASLENDADRLPPAETLWNLPRVQPTHAPAGYDPGSWIPDPHDSSAIRLLQQSHEGDSEKTMTALATVQYPQAIRALDWDPTHQPSAQRYFEALHKARQATLAQEQAESWHNPSRDWPMAGKDERAEGAAKLADQRKASGATSVASEVRFVAPTDLAAVGTLPSTTADSQKIAQVAEPPAGNSSGHREEVNWLKRMFSKRPKTK